ncbi:MAG: aromatic amino acid lyase [Bacteroidales bacterium]|nr:aromatic amino acid lyase [Bacteroidales bacterium]
MTIKVGQSPLDIELFQKVVLEKATVEIAQIAMNRVERSFDFLKEFSADKVIYGINTGFGPMAQYRISDKDLKQLQYNLIRSHASGSGNIIDVLYIRATMLARLNTLLLGFSGVHPTVVAQLATYLNHEIYPIIPEHGGVGASGDLVQLSHLALGLIGEGEAFYKGERRQMSEILLELDLKPIEIHIREGLGLINGTSAMTGIGLVNLLNSRKLYAWAIFASGMINQIVESYDDHISEELNGVKKHKGQNTTAKNLRQILKGSQLLKKREEKLFAGLNGEKVFSEKVQEYYSLRCVPQVLGPVLETIDNSCGVLIGEVNSVNDNPIIDVDNKNVFHGGNFHGDYVSFEMDKLKLAMTKLSMLMERQLNFLMNNKLNEILPPFVNLGTLGLNLGIQGMQFTATSTTAENQVLSNSMYVHSIPNNNDNQDIVSMGANSALMAAKVINNSFEVIAIHIIAILQAVDYLKSADKLSPQTRTEFEKLRKIVPMFIEDDIRYPDIQNMKDYIFNYPLEL